MALQSTIASIQNIRKQRQLELELVELERQWHLELKVLARERLGLVKELCRIQQDQRGADHFLPSLHGPKLRHFADTAQARLQQAKEAKQLRKFNFQPDPVEKVSLHFPLLPSLGEVMEVRTAKELYKNRVQLQKTNFEQCMQDRRNRRRPFWDKAVIKPNRKAAQQDHFASFHFRVRNLAAPLERDHESQISEEMDDFRRGERLIKSPSLPALNSLRRFDSLKPSTIHPSLSNRHSASLDYLPVLKGAARGQQAMLTSFKAPSVSSSAATLPTIEET